MTFKYAVVQKTTEVNAAVYWYETPGEANRARLTLNDQTDSEWVVVNDFHIHPSKVHIVPPETPWEEVLHGKDA